MTNEFKTLHPFRFWCQKVLPLVYDDSLSYYELLCKLTQHVNQLIENQDGMNDNLNQLAKELDDLKEQLPNMIKEEVVKQLDIYVVEKGLVTSVNGQHGDVILTATDIGAIADEPGTVKSSHILNGSVTNNKLAQNSVGTVQIIDKNVTKEKLADGAVGTEQIEDGSVTADKLASGAIPEKLPSPNKLKFTGASNAEYDGSEEVTVNIPAGGGAGSNAPLTFTGAVDATYDGTEAVTVNIPQGGSGGGAVDSVNGETGDVVLKKITFTGAATGEYNGSQDLTVNIPEGGGAGEMKPLHITGGTTLDYDGSEEKTLELYPFQVYNGTTETVDGVVGNLNFPIMKLDGSTFAILSLHFYSTFAGVTAKTKKKIGYIEVPKTVYSGTGGGRILGCGTMIGYTGKIGTAQAGGVGNWRITVETEAAEDADETRQWGIYIASLTNTNQVLIQGDITMVVFVE